MPARPRKRPHPILQSQDLEPWSVLTRQLLLRGHSLFLANTPDNLCTDGLNALASLLASQGGKVPVNTMWFLPEGGNLKECLPR